MISCLRTPSLTFVSGFACSQVSFLPESDSFCDGRFLIEQLQVRVKEPASGQGASSSGLSSVTFIYCLNPFPAGLMGWTREGDIARNFFLHFFLRVNWVRGRKFLSSQGSGFHLPYFLFSSIRWFSWILGLFFSQGVSSLGVSFFPCPSFLPSWEESFPTVEVLVFKEP